MMIMSLTSRGSFGATTLALVSKEPLDVGDVVIVVGYFLGVEWICNELVDQKVPDQNRRALTSWGPGAPPDHS